MENISLSTRKLRKQIIKLLMWSLIDFAFKNKIDILFRSIS